ncbi:Cytochrome c oxidase assembly protein COX19 [Fulvia fulva]|uniref:Cytochrome c oxidase assembly protein COX19 n=1 Tax=Passalora fulva TaxID=5499 RepID=A0A9Q8L7W1_PASFU|nr:Cytochrome c oxidase assembly protein COX19 [Fulvia fulva]KAK4636041.1 Cytochrome c oxidase assembly protein COX19 [Fulvia fulva]KAK4638648.1 Cytochrome c oxidase assembly protein COX19 [Fulvia fulva]UJO12487.1 Cytochrome c oxidase assembly protein COX19 [Fulvia fulva]WPV09178.1 Cytochrome c oxidase assembly protein COX19 [Fulvia fulva]WPV25181.1 Cytochrome c oxidase assembly protein COX19 [Fulvia fulva]
MSTFGSPGGRNAFSKPIPPERGSFPLDHEAECQPIMKDYLQCLRSHRGVNEDACRQLSKNYLQCRMERNLMAPDSMKNLGFQEAPDAAKTTEAKTNSWKEGPDATKNGKETK